MTLYNMEIFVLKGSEIMYLTIPDHISIKSELHVDCSKAIK